VRLLAPLDVGLFAKAQSVQPTSVEDAPASWTLKLATREERRLALRENWRRADPAWARESALLARAEALAADRVDLADRAALDQRQAAVANLLDEARWPETRELLVDMRLEVDRALVLLDTAVEKTAEVRQQQVEDSTSWERESRTLALGLRFAGRGEQVDRQGTVRQAGLPEAPIYTLTTTDGLLLKLTAAPDVATLPALVGKRVTLRGRQLHLMTVDGPVLIIDKVVAMAR
jgi:hypothetical protein